MGESEEQATRRAIATISQSDPLITLLQQVRTGRIQPTDDGLRAVTESWLETYRKVLVSGGFSAQTLRRLNPVPRLTLLSDVGIIPPDHPAVTALAKAFEQAFAEASR
jgi:hypothetical protein